MYLWYSKCPCTIVSWVSSTVESLLIIYLLQRVYTYGADHSIQCPLVESVQCVICGSCMQNETISCSWDPAVLLATYLPLWPREWATDSPYWYRCHLPTRFNQLLGCVWGQWYQRAIRLDRIETLYSCYWATVHTRSHSLPLKLSARIVTGSNQHAGYRVFSLIFSYLNHSDWNNVPSNNVYFPHILLTLHMESERVRGDDKLPT